jgi:hypothetical protein
MSCRPCPAAQAGLDQATALWPRRSTASDGTCSSVTHQQQNPNSDHDPDSRGISHAFDLTHDPGDGCDAHREADEIRRRAAAGQEPRAKYVISNRRYAGPDTGWQWVQYGGVNPHTSHAHVSITTSSENDTSPWYEGADMPLNDADLEAIRTIVRNNHEVTQGVVRNQADAVQSTVVNRSADVARAILDYEDAVVQVTGTNRLAIRAKLKPATKALLDAVD